MPNESEVPKVPKVPKKRRVLKKLEGKPAYYQQDVKLSGENKIDFPDEEENKRSKIKDNTLDVVSDFVSDFVKETGETTKNYKSMINTWYMLYRCIEEKKKKNTLSNVFIPEIYSGIESLVNAIYSLFFSDEKFFITSPVPPETESNARLNQLLMEQQMMNAGFKRKVIQLLRKCAIEGVTPALVYFDIVRQFMPKRVVKKNTEITGIDPMTMQPKVNETETVVIENVETYKSFNPDFDIIPIIDIYASPYMALKDMQGVAYTKCYRWAELKVMESNGDIENIDDIKEELEKDANDSEKELKNARWREIGFNVDAGKFTGKNKYILTHFWGLIPKWWIDVWEDKYESSDSIKDESEKYEEVQGHIITCGKNVLMVEENEYWHKELPVLSAHWVDLDGEFYTPSAVTFSEKTQKELNTTARQMLDHKTFSLYHMWVKDRAANIKNTQLKIQPMQIVEADNINGLREVRPDPAAFSAGEMSKAALKEDIRRAMGALDPLQGIKGGAVRQTRGEVEILAQQSMGRASMIAINLAETFFKPLLQMYYKLNQQYVKEPVKIVGSSQEISSNNMIGDFDFLPKVMTDTVNRATLKNDLMTTLDMVSRMPPEYNIPVIKILRRLYELKGFRDIYEMFPPTTQEMAVLGLNPEQEHEIIKNKVPVYTYAWYDHQKHLEAHVPYRKELLAQERLDEAEILNKDIETHFSYLMPKGEQNSMVLPGQTGAQVMMNPQSLMSANAMVAGKKVFGGNK